MANTVVTRDDIERAMWSMSSWRVDQDDVDRILGMVDQHIRSEVGKVMTECGEAGHTSCCGVMPGELEAKRKTWTAIGIEQGRREAAVLDLDLSQPVEWIGEPSTESAERPSEPLAADEEPSGRLATFRAVDGTLWKLGGQPVVPAVPGDGVHEKRCRTCLAVKSLDEFARDRSKRRTPGDPVIRTQCKACDNARTRELRDIRRRGGV